MKIMIASDIHGSYACCKKLFEKFEEKNCNLMLLLGDLLYHGPRNDLPMEYDCKKVASLLNSYKEKIVAIRGNCDGEVDQMMLEFPILSENAVIRWGQRFITNLLQFPKIIPRFSAPTAKNSSLI